jgi:uncharacterized protein (TIGR03437 family)
MKTVLACTLLLSGAHSLAAAAGNQILLRNFDPADGAPATIAADSTGHLFVVSILTTASAQTSRVVQFDLTGSRLVSLDLTQLEYPTAAVTDAQGNLIVVGVNSSYQGIVLKMDPKLQSALLLITLPASIRAVTADASGNLYLTGITSSASFPLTANAYQTTPPLWYGFGTAAFAFVTEISPDGDKLLYSTYFGSATATCLGGSFCIGKFGVTTGTAIALDASGAVVIAGSTTASGLPTTPGTLATTCTCEYNYSYGTGITSGFVAKFQPGAAQQLQWSTFVNGGAAEPVSVTLNALALDTAGNVIVAGGGPPGMPTTAGGNSGGGYLAKLNSTGSGVIWGRYVDNTSGLTGLLGGAQGEVVVSGYEPIGGYANSANSIVARLTSDASTLIGSYSGPLVYSLAGPALALTSAGGFAAVYPSGALWIETAASGPSLLNIANSASDQYSNALAGAELVTLYGAAIGPQTPTNGQLQNNAFTTSLGGCQVLFDGVAAPLLYADSGQINTVVPHLVGPHPHIQVVTPAGTIDGPTVPVPGNPVPDIFQSSLSGTAAALNEDGSINSESNPAHAGSIVAVFATGGGAGYFPDGSLVPIEAYGSSFSVWVVAGLRSLEVDYAGDAPGLVAGVMQVNFRLPDTLPGNTFGFGYPFSLVIGGVESAASQIFVAP